MLRFSRILSSVLLVAALHAQQDARKASEAAPQKYSHSESDDEAIAKIAEAWMGTYNGGDVAMVAAPYTADGYYLSAHVLAHGREAIQAYWERGIAAGGH